LIVDVEHGLVEDECEVVFAERNVGVFEVE
jgi:hypothetical protein